MTATRMSNVMMRWLTGAMVGVLCMAGASPGTVAAQDTGLVDDTTYVLEATGDEVTWAEPWEFDDDISEIGDGFEIVALNAELSSLLISVLPNGLDIEEARDIVLDEFAAGTDEFATIDRGAYENISYSLDLANVGGTDLGVFTLFRKGSGQTPTFAYIFISSIQGFGDGLTSSQERIAVAGDPIFKGVDGDGLQVQLEQNRGAAPDPDEETPEPDDRDATDVPDGGTTVPDTEEDGDPTKVAGGDTSVVDLKNRTPDASSTDGSDGGDDEIDDELVDLGVVSQGEYVSPQFGTEVNWNEDWGINENLDTPLQSDTRNNVDVVTLADDLNTYLSLSIREAGDVTPADLIDLWTSDEFVDDTEIEDTEPDEILLSDSGRDIGSVVQLADLEDGTEIVIIREVQLLDGGKTVVIITFFQTVGAAEDGVVSVQQGVEVDGAPVLGFYNVEEIVDALE